MSVKILSHGLNVLYIVFPLIDRFVGAGSILMSRQSSSASNTFFRGLFQKSIDLLGFELIAFNIFDELTMFDIAGSNSNNEANNLTSKRRKIWMFVSGAFVAIIFSIGIIFLLRIRKKNQPLEGHIYSCVMEPSRPSNELPMSTMINQEYHSKKNRLLRLGYEDDPQKNDEKNQPVDTMNVNFPIQIEEDSSKRDDEYQKCGLFGCWI